MAEEELEVRQILNILNCVTCGVLFGIPIKLVNYRRTNGEQFFCPNGHAQFFEGKAAKEWKELATAREVEIKELKIEKCKYFQRTEQLEARLAELEPTAEKDHDNGDD